MIVTTFPNLHDSVIKLAAYLRTVEPFNEGVVEAFTVYNESVNYAANGWLGLYLGDMELRPAAMGLNGVLGGTVNLEVYIQYPSRSSEVAAQRIEHLFKRLVEVLGAVGFDWTTNFGVNASMQGIQRVNEFDIRSESIHFPQMAVNFQLEIRGNT